MPSPSFCLPPAFLHAHPSSFALCPLPFRSPSLPASRIPSSLSVLKRIRQAHSVRRIYSSSCPRTTPGATSRCRCGACVSPSHCGLLSSRDTPRRARVPRRRATPDARHLLCAQVLYFGTVFGILSCSPFCLFVSSCHLLGTTSPRSALHLYLARCPRRYLRPRHRAAASRHPPRRSLLIVNFRAPVIPTTAPHHHHAAGSVHCCLPILDLHAHHLCHVGVHASVPPLSELPHPRRRMDCRITSLGFLSCSSGTSSAACLLCRPCARRNWWMSRRAGGGEGEHGGWRSARAPRAVVSA
ncbi:hypothetical protein C8J57DRAFT_1295138 [Mycena rebaudengoi]|nr:hypothetical protein C8J57DRAFT_1295138 [Mycena rebaudengoi]